MSTTIASQWMRTYQRLLALRARDLTADIAERSCIVLAPHPDDETLGCGATIARKRAAGTSVAVVFATDGRHSHPGRIRPAELARRRREEGLRACRELGVPEGCVFFLGFEDGTLAEHAAEAAHAISRLTGRFNPDELLVSTALDRHPDHVALRQVVQLLAGRGVLPPRVYEYPVWFWAARAWREHRSARWTRMIEAGGFDAVRILGQMGQAGGALVAQTSALVRLQVRLVRAHPFLEQKRAALRQHASQLIAPSHDLAWPTLPPALIERCCAPYELFFEQQLVEPAPAPPVRRPARASASPEPLPRLRGDERPRATEPPLPA